MSASLNEFIEHAREVVGFCGRGSCTESEATERIEAFLHAGSVERSAMKQSHFVIPERRSFTRAEEELLARAETRAIGESLYKQRMAAQR